ncbi:Rab3 GTPase-activating protein regulatory subunit N-terminus-domain-containing protein [Blakeslea trispora]|nr:Rab3 GTPase-activating protein regulatory subunit N-terminus-domain-containing protein [Blakeslea trispora]
MTASQDGNSLVLAYKTKFVMVQLNREGEYMALGQGSGCQLPDEEITCVVCLPLFVPSTRSIQHYVMCGYTTGWIRVFSETGILLTEQQLETTAVLKIHMRTPPAVFRTQPTHQDEDITILFKGNRVVSVDGQSLWMALRVCDGQRESGIDASRMHTAFTYKKWELTQQEEVKDIISLGPSPQESNEDIPKEFQTTAHAFPTHHATCRYMAVGRQPMVTYYATSESTRPFMSAASMASYVVSRVASPVFSLAKSWWSGNSSEMAHVQNTPYVPEMRKPPPSHIELATPMPAVLTLEDSERNIHRISVSPPTTSSQHHALAATSDALGRVILWDVAQGEMLRLWKGVRDAVCGWVEVFEHELYQTELKTSSPRVLLFLVIYTSKRGILKVFQMRHGQQVGAYHVGSDWHLVPCGREPLGSSMVSVDRRRTKSKDLVKDGLSSCLLIGPDGEVRRIKIILKTSSSTTQPS